jgi:putative ABC transport system substrate-binding protein
MKHKAHNAGIKHKSWIFVGVLFFVLVVPHFNTAAQAQKLHKIAFLSPAEPPDPSIPAAAVVVPNILRDAGYVEGRNLQVERRFANGKLELLPEFAKDLVARRMDVIVAVSPTAIKPALDATRTVPIVMGFGKDPVRDGLIASLSKPGGNLTGVVVAPEDVLAGKRLELIKETVPQAQRVALLGTQEPSSKLQVQEAQKIAPSLGVKTVVIEVHQANYKQAFREIQNRKLTPCSCLQARF